MTCVEGRKNLLILTVCLLATFSFQVQPILCEQPTGDRWFSDGERSSDLRGEPEGRKEAQGYAKTMMKIMKDKQYVDSPDLRPGSQLPEEILYQEEEDDEKEMADKRYMRFGRSYTGGGARELRAGQRSRVLEEEDEPELMRLAELYEGKEDPSSYRGGATFDDQIYEPLSIKDKRYMRFGRSEPSKRYMRFGKRSSDQYATEKRYMRFGRGDVDPEKLEEAKRYMRFGRSENGPTEKRYMRFGRSSLNSLKFHEDENALDKRYMRFGKKSVETEESDVGHGGAEKRYMRFGRSIDKLAEQENKDEKVKSR